MENNHLIHLYNRAGFGILPKEINTLKKYSISKNVTILFKKAKKHNPLTISLDSLHQLKEQTETLELKSKIVKENRKLIEQLNHHWYKKLYTSKAVLHDKMMLFWTNHFVCSSNSIEQTLAYLTVIEKHALGNFKDFILEISKNPMMIKYLNNQQNRKKHPNENYARELMELFTLGTGHYTETDIKESARAFTGWSTNKTGFVFRKRQHDNDLKTFMGKTGNFNGTDIINIILEHPQCALFISEKIYKEFVNPKPNPKHIKKMARVFRENYNIAELMEFTLTSNWFYDNKNIGVKIKSPVELIVSIHRTLPFKFKKKKFFRHLQYSLGQKLLYPPNVAGWPGGKQWIDANTIMIRLKLASSIAQQKEIAYEPESTFEDDFETISKHKKNKAHFIFSSVNWNAFQKNVQNTTQKELQQCFIGSRLIPETQRIVNTMQNYTTQNFCIALMSLPEFQMC